MGSHFVNGGAERHKRSHPETPKQFVDGLRDVVNKAVESGVPFDRAATVLVRFAAAIWQECWPGESDSLTQVLKQEFKSFDSITPSHAESMDAAASEGSGRSL
jgi:hypothetical protein